MFSQPPLLAVPALIAASTGVAWAKLRHSFSPRAMCIHRFARGVGHRAVLKVRLALKPEQMTKWQAHGKAADAVSAKELSRCTSLPTDMTTRPTFIERVNRSEEMAKNRLEIIGAGKPSPLAPYSALSPEQQAILDRSDFGYGRRGRLASAGLRRLAAHGFSTPLNQGGWSRAPRGFVWAELTVYRDVSNR